MMYYELSYISIARTYPSFALNNPTSLLYKVLPREQPERVSDEAVK